MLTPLWHPCLAIGPKEAKSLVKVAGSVHVSTSSTSLCLTASRKSQLLYCIEWYSPRMMLMCSMSIRGMFCRRSWLHFSGGAVNLFDISDELHNSSGVVEVQRVHSVQRESAFFKQCIPQLWRHQGKNTVHQGCEHSVRRIRVNTFVFLLYYTFKVRDG